MKTKANLADVLAKMAELQNATLKGVYESELKDLNIEIQPDDTGKTNLLIILYLQLKSIIKLMDNVRDSNKLRTLQIDFDYDAILKEIAKEYESVTIKS